MNLTRVATAFLIIQSALAAQTLAVIGVSQAGYGGLAPGVRASIYYGPPNLRLEPGTVAVRIGGRSAAVLGVGEGRVEVQLPVELSPGPYTLVMTASGRTSMPFNIRLEPFAPALVRLTRQTPPGEISDLTFRVGCVPPENTAVPGEIVTAFAVGLGATDPVVPTGTSAPASPLATTLVKPRISVLWQEAEVLESVLVPGEIGLYRVAFRVPPGDGWHPMALHIGGYDSGARILPVGRGLINVSSATWQIGPAAPEEILVARTCSASLATGGPFVADPDNPPTALGATTVKVKDSAGIERLAPLYYVDRFQVNYVVPSDTALGSASVTVTSSDGSVSSGRLEIQSVAPGIFTLCCAEEFFDDDGIVPAGQVIRIRDGVRSAAPLFEVNAAGKLRRLPVELRDTDDAYLVLYGTGLRFRSSLANVIPGGGEVVYAGPQGEFPGLDQINLRIRGGSGVRSGWWSLRFTVDGRMLSAGSIVFN